MSENIVKYTANDGQNVELTPTVVLKYIVSGSAKPTDAQVAQFMAQCQARGLNPLAKDCYLTTYENRDGSTTASVITSKDYFMRTAASQPDYDGMAAGVVVVTRDGEMEYREGALYGLETERLVGGWCNVYSKQRSHPSRAVVSLEEYDQHRSLWKSKPATMIRKVAVVQALREAYPEQFSGVYDSAEMPEVEEPASGQADVTTAEQVEATVTEEWPEAVVTEIEEF